MSDRRARHGALEVVIVLPLLQLAVEHLGVVDEGAVGEPVELFGVDAVGALNLAVEAGGAGFDVAVADALVERVVVERGAELGAVEFSITAKSEPT